MKDDAGTKFAWVADNPEIEDRAIAVMEQASSVGLAAGKEAPDAIRGSNFGRYGSAISGTVLFLTDLAPWIRSLFSEKSLSGISRRSSPRVCGTMDPQGETWDGLTHPRIKISRNR